jgi:hypothetical protein
LVSQVIAGKGETICANKNGCLARNDLRTLELPFSYKEDGDGEALVRTINKRPMFELFSFFQVCLNGQIRKLHFYADIINPPYY